MGEQVSASLRKLLRQGESADLAHFVTILSDLLAGQADQDVARSVAHIVQDSKVDDLPESFCRIVDDADAF